MLEGAQLDDVVRDSRFDGLAAWRDWVAKAETQGAADVDGKPAWKVLSDAETGLGADLLLRPGVVAGGEDGDDRPNRDG